jgi:hypothetical protein
MPYSDGDVICPVTQRDGHPDLLAEREVLDHVAAFDPTTCADLVREVMRLREIEREQQALDKLTDRHIKSEISEALKQ